jgi:hypothetical protein
MTEVSKSPERHTFQRDGYVRRQEEKGEPVNENYLDYFQQIIEEDKHKFADSERRKDNLEYDLLTTEWILEKVRSSRVYAQNLYAAMCNRDFLRLEVIPILKDQLWSCSWRYAGGIIADMRQEGDYIDWYCSGMHAWDDVSPEEFENLEEDAKIAYIETKKFVGEGYVTDEIREDLIKLGWKVIDDGKMV